MKRHISIFAHLLCAFAAVGLAGKTAAVSYFASSTHPFTITDYDGSDLKFDCYNEKSGGYYHIFDVNYGITDLTMNRDDRIAAKFPDGYRFDGWYTKADGWSGDEVFISEVNKCIAKDQWIDGATIEDNAGRWGNRPTIVAKYGIIQFEVTFNTDGGTPSPIAAIGGNTIESENIKLPSVTKDGYDFAGWKNAKDKVFPAGDTSGKAFWDDVEKAFYADLTAQWTAKTYAVTYQTENCTLTSPPASGTYDQPLSIAWMKDADVGEKSTVTVYNEKDGTIKSVETTGTTFDFKMSDLGKYYESVVIKVACTKNVRHVLTLKKDVGVKAITWKTNNCAWVRSETDVNLSGLLATTTWAVKVEEADVERGYEGPNPDSGTMSVDVTRTLNGTPHQYTVDYDLQGGEKKSGGNYPHNENFGDIFNVSAPVPPTGRSFLGWIVVTNKDDLACAKWGTASDDVTHDVLPDTPCANGATGDVFFKNLTSINKDEIWLKAKWSGLTHTITVETEPQDAGSASGGGEIEEGANAKLTATPNDGYSFCCWTNSATGVFTDDNPWTFTVTADATYTAVFTGNVVQVIFVDLYGGVAQPNSKLVTFGKPYGELATVKYGGLLEFSGWMDDDNNDVTANTKVTSTAKIQYLRSKPPTERNPIIIFADESYANTWVTNTTTTAGDPFPEPPEFSRDGYWPNGWVPALPEKATEDFTTYAQWMSLADVLDCPGSGLVFTIQGEWEVRFGEPPASAQGGSWMQLDDGSGHNHITTSISKPGTLTFHYKGNNMLVKVGTDSQPLPPAVNWTKTSVVITEASVENPVDVDFSCPEQHFTPASLDWVIWEPGVLPTYYTVTFKDPSGTFTNETQSVKDGESAIAPNWEANKFESLAWDADFSKVVSNLDVNAVWTCRVEFVDHEAGNLNLPVTNRTERGGSVASPTFTPPEGKNFGGWDPAVPEAIESNMTCVAVWTAKPVYTVSYVYGQTTNKVTKTEGDTINLAGATFTREGYTQKAWSSSEDGLSRDYEFNDPYSDDADLVLYPYWEKDAVVDPIAEALDCPDSGLTFTAAGGWSVFTNAAFAKVGDSCMSNSTAGATLTTTLKGPGTLSFWWAGSSVFGGKVELVVTAGTQELLHPVLQGNKKPEWTAVTNRIDATAEPIILNFYCKTMNSTVFCAIDGLVWTPDQTHPEPTEADKVTISSAAVSDGKFTLSFQSNEKFDYNLLTNANLLINSWGIMETLVGDGKVLTFEPKIIEGQPQLFYKVDTIQKQD